MGAILGMILPSLISAGKAAVGEKITGAVLGKLGADGQVAAKGVAGSKTLQGVYGLLALVLTFTVPQAVQGNFYALGLSVLGIVAAGWAHFGRKTASVPLGKG